MTGIVNAGSGKMLMFKQNITELLTGSGPQSWNEHTLVEGIGCIAHRSIAVVNGHPVWQDEDGLRAYDGYNMALISTQVQMWFSELERSKISDVCALGFRSPESGIPQYLLSVVSKKDGIYHDEVITGSFFEDGTIGWGKQRGFEARSLWNATDSNDYESWMSGGKGVIRQHDLDRDVKQDESEFIMGTLPLCGQNPLVRKHFGQTEIFYQADRPVDVDVLHTFDVDRDEQADKVSFDVTDLEPIQFSGEKISDKASYVDRHKWKVKEIPLKGEGIQVQVRLVHQGAGTNFRVLRVLTESTNTGAAR